MELSQSQTAQAPVIRSTGDPARTHLGFPFGASTGRLGSQAETRQASSLIPQSELNLSSWALPFIRGGPEFGQVPSFQLIANDVFPTYIVLLSLGAPPMRESLPPPFPIQVLEAARETLETNPRLQGIFDKIRAALPAAIGKQASSFLVQSFEDPETGEFRHLTFTISIPGLRFEEYTELSKRLSGLASRSSRRIPIAVDVLPP